MIAMTLEEFLRDRDERVNRAGIVFTEELVESLRNKGHRRTPEKREMLRQIEERCRAAGVEPLKAYF